MSGEQAAEGVRQRKRRRWGDAVDAQQPAAAAAASSDTAATAAATTATAKAATAGGGGVVDSKAKALALQASVRARLAALQAKKKSVAAPAVTSGVAAGMKRPAPAPPLAGAASSSSSASSKRAKVYELDMSVTAPTFNKVDTKPKRKINPYLAHTSAGGRGGADDGDVGGPAGEGEGTAAVDERLQRASKQRSRHKPLTFVEPGLFTEIAERKRSKAARAEQSGFVSGRKEGQYVRKAEMENIYGTTDVADYVDGTGFGAAPRPEAQDAKTIMPAVVEWWDMELLPGKLRRQVAAYEGKIQTEEAQSRMKQLKESTRGEAKIAGMINPEVDGLLRRCSESAALAHCKTAALVQHIVPIRPPGSAKADEKPVEPTLYLTKKELKRQRKLRKQAKQRELQDLQAAGLVPAPEPRLTLKNFIRVLGDQAYVDPSQMEQKVLEQVQARQRAHLDRNARNKLTKAQRSEKRARNLLEDTAKTGVHVAVFYVKDMSHPYHRTKVDLNAQQWNVTGGVLECENPSLACVIAEGGPKSIKKYTRLMTVRMKWKGPDDAEDESDDDEAVDGDGADGEEGTKRHRFNPENKCGLVWTGIATKRYFKGFVFQSCETSDQARKVLTNKGVGHFWDQTLSHASGREEEFRLKLADSDDGGGGDGTVKMEED